MTSIITINQLITIFDLIGVIASSIAATILAERKGLDAFGACFIAAVASIGGGTLRDVLLNRYPIFWLVSSYYLIIIFMASLTTLVFYRWITQLERPLRIFDAIGLAAFTIIGIEAALMQGMSAFIAVIMGVMTATFGGISRDIICNEIPLVLHKEIYITASLVGGCLLLVLMKFGISKEIAYSITLVVIFSIRMVAVYKDLRLPRFYR